MIIDVVSYPLQVGATIGRWEPYGIDANRAQVAGLITEKGPEVAAGTMREILF
jgi:hypothetical protein